MSILTTETPLPDSEALKAGTVGRGSSLKHGRQVLGRAAEKRGVVPRGAQVGEHGGPIKALQKVGVK